MVSQVLQLRLKWFLMSIFTITLQILFIHCKSQIFWEQLLLPRSSEHCLQTELCHIQHQFSQSCEVFISSSLSQQLDSCSHCFWTFHMCVFSLACNRPPECIMVSNLLHRGNRNSKWVISTTAPVVCMSWVDRISVISIQCRSAWY